MAGLIPAGFIVDPSKDIFPTTGAHLDPRVIPQFGPNKGKPINPRSAKFLLQNLMLGDTPVVEQKGGNWQFNFPVTSEFGQRKAPTPGASTFHQGIDIAAPAGTAIKYKGSGSYKPGQGLGTISTTDSQGNPYDIQLLHTTPGKAAEVATNTTALPTGDTSSRTEDILKAFLYGAQIRKDEKPEKTFQQELKEQLIGSLLSQALNPGSFLSSYQNSNPFLMGQSTANSDYLNGLFG